MYAVQSPARNNTPIPDDDTKHMEPWERTARSGCTVFWCIVTILGVIGGVTMIAVGGAKLGDSLSSRHRLVEEYNNKVNANIQYHSQFTGANATVQQQPSYGASPAKALLHTTPVRVIGSTRDITGSLTSTILSTSISPFYNSSSTVEVILNNVSSRRSIQYTKTEISSISCSARACAKDCQEEWDRECDTASLTRACKSIYNEDATYVGNAKCERDDLCGSCHYTTYIESVCMVMNSPDTYTFSSNDWDVRGKFLTMDHSMSSCYYPFAADSHIYSPVKPIGDTATVSFQLRASNDPFIIMQRVTQGTMHFGELPEDAYRSSMVLMIIGLGLILSFGFGMCCYMCCCGRCCPRRQAHRRVAPDGHMEMQTGTTIVNMTPAPLHQIQVTGRPEYGPEYSARSEDAPLPPPVQMHHVRVHQVPQNPLPQPGWPQPRPVEGVPYSQDDEVDVIVPPRKGTHN